MLTEEQASEITMFMRVLNLGAKNPEIVKSNPDFYAALEEAKAKMEEIMNLLTPEEQDWLLERYRAEAEKREGKQKG